MDRYFLTKKTVAQKFSLTTFFARSNQAGFTLVELLMVMGIVGILLGLTVINLTSIVPRANLQSSVDVLINDLSQIQSKAMSGKLDGASTPPAYGVRFESNQYILFQGITYNASDPVNLIVPLPESVRVSAINLPSDTIVYATVSGEIQNFSTSQNSVTFRNTVTNETQTLEWNQLGVITTM